MEHCLKLTEYEKDGSRQKFNLITSCCSISIKVLKTNQHNQHRSRKLALVEIIVKIAAFGSHYVANY